MNAIRVDQPREIRAGEELPVENLAAYLRAQLPAFDGTLVVKQFPSGHSNLTYLLSDGTHEWVLRRPPFGAQIKTAHDMAREYRILARLIDVYPKIPRPRLYCDDTRVIGAPFYVMERVSGVVLRARLPDGFALTPEQWRTLSRALIDNLAAIHALDYTRAGLSDLGKPSGYVERQVRGWTERYHNARSDDLPEIEDVARWLADNLPRESDAALIHNDYKYDNLVLDPRDLTIRAVLDWEMATLGDPLMDLGTTLGYWVEATDPEELRTRAFGPTMLTGNLTRRELIERYAQVSGREVSRVEFYHVFGLFKIAVIVQQIYARYKRGDTHDARFASLIHTVRVLSQFAQDLIRHRAI